MNRDLLVLGVAVAWTAALVAAPSAWAEAPYQAEWTRQLATDSDEASDAIVTDSAGNVFITGWTDGSLGGPNAGESDAFVAKYDAAGNLAWTRQLGTSSGDGGAGIATDLAGNLFITGETSGSLGGPNAGGYDAFVAKYDAAGNLAWTQQLGTGGTDESRAIATDVAGNLFITGLTTGSLGGPHAGGMDAFLVKFVVPEPGTVALMGLGGLAMVRRRPWRRRGGRCPPCEPAVFIVAAVLLTSSTSSASIIPIGPDSYIINAAANQCGLLAYYPPAVTLNVQPGVWRMTPINPNIDARATYMAWNYFGNGTEWVWGLGVCDAVTKEDLGGRGRDHLYDTPEEAFYADPPLQPVDIIITAPRTVCFVTGDSYIGDNQGGASVRFELIPEPGTAALVGLAGLAMVRRLRQ